MNDKPSDLALVTHRLRSAVDLFQLFGGEYVVGIVMTKCFFEGDNGQTVDSVLAQLDGTMSDDTVRRRLERMVEKGLLTKSRQGRATVYNCKQDVAERAARLMKL